MIEVTAAVIVSGGKFLICRRPEGKSCAGLWEFPGGKLEPGESGEDCIKREIREELAAEITVSGEICDVINESPDKTVHLHFYKAALISDGIRLLEHSECRMISPDEVGAYEFCPADRMMLAETDMRKVVYAS